MAQTVGRGIALLFHDRGTRRWVSGQQHAPAAIYPRENPVPILQEAGCGPVSGWAGGKSRPHRDLIPDRPPRSSVAIPTELPVAQSIYRLSYPAHVDNDDNGGKIIKEILF